MLSLGEEGQLGSRDVAERCAAVYRECVQIGYETIGNPAMAFRTRIGVLEMPSPDPRLGHRPPREDVDALMSEIRARFEQGENARHSADG